MAINLTVKETEAPTPIPEAMYKAKIQKVEEKTGEFGDYLLFTFEITEGKQKGVTRTIVASRKLSRTKSGKASKLYELVKTLTRIAPEAGQTFNIEELVGKPCQILVKNDKEKNGITYQTISMVMPV